MLVLKNLIEQYIDGLIDELTYATKDEIGCTLDYSIGRNSLYWILNVNSNKSF